MFPEIRRIEDVLPAIEGRQEFIVAERDHYDIVNYVVNMPDTFPPLDTEESAIRRECRGIAFDKKGNILSRPWQKFFNSGEREETLSENIDFSRDHDVLEKLDGSMVRPLYIEEFDGFRLGTKMGITDTAMRAEVYVSEHVGYFRFFREMHSLGLTPIFEWCSLEDRIVIRYEEPCLRLTGIREMVEGNYKTHAEMSDIANFFQIPVVQRLDNVAIFEDFSSRVRSLQDSEGVVVSFHDGQRIKLKADLYCRLHKSKEIASDQRKIYELILDEKIDDIKPQLQKPDLFHVEELEKRMSNAVEVLSKRFSELLEKFESIDNKEFALGPAKSLSPLDKSSVFSMKSGRTPLDVSLDNLKKNSRNRKRMEEFSEEFSLGLFDQFTFPENEGKD